MSRTDERKETEEREKEKKRERIKKSEEKFRRERICIIVRDGRRK
jgi:hypothetical protein